MKTLLKIVGGFFGVVILLVAGVFSVARLSDGPIAIAPGGPLKSGEWASVPISDWGFAEHVMEIEHQLADDDTSRTVWLIVHEGEAYIPCSLGFPPLKDWHYRAVEDGRAIIRVADVKYPITMTRVEDESLVEALKVAGGEKYGATPPSSSGVWYFRLESREA